MGPFLPILEGWLEAEELKDLETTRANGASSRNVRLAAIKSFMRYIEHRVPSALEQVRRVLAIPMRKTDTRVVRHLATPEIQAQALLDPPKPIDWAGIRDRAMLHLAFAAGLRVSELVGLRLEDLTLQPHASILIHGKDAGSVLCHCGRRPQPRCVRGWRCAAPFWHRRSS